MADGRPGIYRTTPTGEEAWLSTMSRSDLFGETQMLFGSNRLFSCRALERSSLIKIPRALFMTQAISVRLSFLRTTIARNWRVASFIFNDFLRLPTSLDSSSFDAQAGRSAFSLSEESSPSNSPVKPLYNANNLSNYTSPAPDAAASPSDPVMLDKNPINPSNPDSAKGQQPDIEILDRFFARTEEDEKFLQALETSENVIELHPGDCLQRGTLFHDRLWILLSGRLHIRDNRSTNDKILERGICPSPSTNNVKNLMLRKFMQPRNQLDHPPKTLCQGAVLGAMAWFSGIREKEDIPALAMSRVTQLEPHVYFGLYVSVTLMVTTSCRWLGSLKTDMANCRP